MPWKSRRTVGRGRSPSCPPKRAPLPHKSASLDGRLGDPALPPIIDNWSSSPFPVDSAGSLHQLLAYRVGWFQRVPGKRPSPRNSWNPHVKWCGMRPPRALPTAHFRQAKRALAHPHFKSTAKSSEKTSSLRHI